MTLDQIAIKYGTDKSTLHHGYAPIYDSYLTPLRDTHVNLLEVGIGGYEFYDRGGQSLNMWREYFTSGQIIGADVHAKDPELAPGCLIRQADQDNPQTIIDCVSATPMDIIIDDGSHISPLTIKTLMALWDILKPGGLYFIEDTHTSYWKKASDGQDFKGGTHKNTIMNYLKEIADRLNLIEKYDVEFIHFYKQLAVIKKRIM